MTVDVLTIFPDMFSSFLESSLIGKAIERGDMSVRLHDIRDWTKGRHRAVDDAPYGGDEGMVMMPGPVCEAVDAVSSIPPVSAPSAVIDSSMVTAPSEEALQDDVRKIMLCPRGRTFDAAYARELSSEKRLLMLCGRYEGFDARIPELTGCERVSLGDFVLSGGELASMVIIEAVSRFIPGVIGSAGSVIKDSFEDNGLLDWPGFTRPAEYRGMKVPDVLLSGNHRDIQRWRRYQQLEATRQLRPDLYDETTLDDDDLKLLKDNDWEVWL